MQNFLAFIPELLIYFWSALLDINKWPISFSFYLAIVAFPALLLAAIFFHRGRVVC